MAFHLDEKQQKTVKRLREMRDQWSTIRVALLVLGALILVLSLITDFDSEFAGLFIGALAISLAIQNWHGRPGFLLIDVIDELEKPESKQ